MTEMINNPANQPTELPDFGTYEVTQGDAVYVPVPMPDGRTYGVFSPQDELKQPAQVEQGLVPIDDDAYYQERDEMVERRSLETIATLVGTAGSVQSFEDRAMGMVERARQGAAEIRAEQIDQVNRSMEAMRVALERIRRNQIALIDTEHKERLLQIEDVEEAAIAFTGAARGVQGGLERSVQQMDSQHTAVKKRRMHAIDEHNGGVELIGTLEDAHEQTIVRIDDNATKIEGARTAIDNCEARIRELETQGAVIRRGLEQAAYSQLASNPFLASREIDDDGTQVIDTTSLNRALEHATKGQESMELGQIRSDVDSLQLTVASHRRAEGQMLDTQAFERKNLSDLEEDITSHTQRVLELGEKVQALREQGAEVDEYTKALEEITQRFQWLLDGDVVSALHQQNVPKQLKVTYEHLVRYLDALNKLTGGSAGLTESDLEIKYDDRLPLALGAGTQADIDLAGQEVSLEEQAYELMRTVEPMLRANSALSAIASKVRGWFKPEADVTYRQVESEE